MKISDLLDQCEKIFLGKRELIELTMASVISRGNILLEDLPGVGKTTLSKLLAKSMNLELNRVQFTNDILPADIIGTNIYDRQKGDFIFHRGPIFTEIVLADELNRAPARTQSALLQAMEERIVSVDGKTYELPEHFVVVATQNPRTQLGTHPLPESQIDRFMIKTQIGFAQKEYELELLKGEDRMELLAKWDLVLPDNYLKELRIKANTIHVSDKIYEYILSILNFTRTHADMNSLSPRAGQDLVSLGKTMAMIREEKYLIPEIIQEIMIPVIAHRLIDPAKANRDQEIELARQVMEQVPMP